MKMEPEEGGHRNQGTMVHFVGVVERGEDFVCGGVTVCVCVCVCVFWGVDEMKG